MSVEEKSATGVEVNQVVEQWYTYLKRKEEVNPEIVRRGGIVPRLVPRLLPDGTPTEEPRTVKFSLVREIAPELEALGGLVRARTPHVYVEGVRSGNDTNDVYELLDKSVLFDEIWDVKPPSVVENPEKMFPYNLRPHIPEQSRFLLHVYSANDLDGARKLVQVVTVEDLIIFDENFLTSDEKSHALTVRSGYIRIKPFGYYRGRKFIVYPSTSAEMEMTCESFRRAISLLS